MNDKKAIETLATLLNKYPLGKEEEEAVRLAIGILGWSTLSEGRGKTLKQAREKRNRGE
jgi:hypothetical protein